MFKKFPKILITTFLFIFTLQLVGLIFLMAMPKAGQAADVKFVPQVGIGDDFKKGVAQEVGGSTSMIAKYIKAIYKYALGIVGILATVVMMFGGVLWITAGGNAERISNAKSWLAAALTGLVLALSSYMILYIVNPGLVEFRVTKVKEPGKDYTTFDALYPCGQQIPDQELICGTKCSGAAICQKVPKGTADAIECPESIPAGSGDYWLCSTLSGGGTNCCTENNDSQCNSGFVCNMRIITADCIGKGVCAVKQELNGICGENADCISNNCDTGFLATYRCQ